MTRLAAQSWTNAGFLGDPGCSSGRRGRLFRRIATDASLCTITPLYLMISKLTLRFGRAPGLPSETIEVTPVTVFVGPNFSGKSRVLTEIQQYTNSGQQLVTNVILDRIVFQAFNAEQARAHIARVRLAPRVGETVSVNHMLVGKKAQRMQVPAEALIAALQDPNGRPGNYCQWYLTYNTLMLDGRNRINLVAQQSAGDLQQPPTSSLQALFRDDASRAEVRRIVYDAFFRYFVIDPTHLGNFRIRLSSMAPQYPAQERGIDQEAVAFHANALPIEEASDGVKAFVGIIMEVIAGDPHVLLLDEPEAFLHPSLAFNLGKEVSKASLHSEKRLFVATHSPNFVMGCIQSGAPVNIVRLTYRDNVATARILAQNEILNLMRNPLLRSTGVLSGLFYEFVVVTESDADRAFYQEINERLLSMKPEWGIPNCLFLNAQNKQTVQVLVRPLRELGIATAAVVDIDVIKDGGSVWTNVLSSAFIPPLSHQALSNLRSQIKGKLEATGKDMKRDGGVDLLQIEDREATNNFFDQLQDYGVFVVRRGELESWLEYLGAAGHGPGWLVEMFEKMGEDPESPTYVKPSGNDVWRFIGDIKNWLMDPRRHGIPT
jgi:ABC-type cobalamin/Fe3+-siderophores transport system ATPase subunit